jgi:hypothetical protein
MKERLRSELENGDKANRRESKRMNMYESDGGRLSINNMRSAWLYAMDQV